MYFLFQMFRYYLKETNNINGTSVVEENPVKFFDCNEGDIK